MANKGGGIIGWFRRGRRTTTPTGPETAGPETAASARVEEVAAIAALDRLVTTRKIDRARVKADEVWALSHTGSVVAGAHLVTLEIEETGYRPKGFEDAVDAALTEVDRLWVDGDAELATYTLAAALRLLFHRELHSDANHFPLSHDPDGFLSRLRVSTMFADLTAPRVVAVIPSPSPPLRTKVFTGAYPRFAAPVVAALQGMVPGGGEESTVESASLTDHDKRFNYLAFNTQALAWRVATHPAGRAAASIGGPPDAHADVFQGVDLAWMEWADRGTMWASVTAPETTRIVVRMHGMDLFTPWVHLIDYSRISDVVFVSAPFRDLAVRILADRLTGVRLHVIEHAAEADRFDRPTVPGADRTLGMIGWGKLVKDPAWALDVLTELRRHDPTWRLLLVGTPLDRSGSQRAADYAADFWRRVEGDLAGAVELVPQTDDVPAYAARMGFILSTSRRESFHLAVLEGAFAGAVPVVRHWPVYSWGQGPAELYPPEWVVDTPPAAAERILALGEPTARAHAGRAAQDWSQGRFDSDTFARRIRAVARGDHDDR